MRRRHDLRSWKQRSKMKRKARRRMKRRMKMSKRRMSRSGIQREEATGGTG